MLSVQVLVAAMNQTDFSLVEKIGITTSAIIGNQCDRNEIITQVKNNGRKITYLSFQEKGVGLNRNNALFRATADICTFADDDMRLSDNYEEIVRHAFEELPDADAIIFNIDTIGGCVKRRKTQKVKRIKLYNALNYGAARLSVRNSSVMRYNLCFNRLFGGGSVYSSGEDTLFICDMLKKHLKVYVYPATIGSVMQNDSTWFHGYTQKYLYDKGALYEAISPILGPLLCLQLLFRHKEVYKESGLTVIGAYILMRQGSKGYRSIATFKEEHIELA